MNRNLTPKRDALAALGAAPERIYIAHGVTGTNQHRPGSRAGAAADCAGYPPSGARPNARARSPTKDQPDYPDEASLGERGAPRVGGRCSQRSLAKPCHRTLGETDCAGALQRRVRDVPKRPSTSDACFRERT
jgi:hypothetical protein